MPHASETQKAERLNRARERAIVCSHPLPCSLRRFAPEDPAIQRVEPELWLLFGLWPSFGLGENSFPGSPSPLACFFRASICFPGSVVGRGSNRVFPPLTAACFQQGPFAPRSLPASP